MVRTNRNNRIIAVVLLAVMLGVWCAPMAVALAQQEPVQIHTADDWAALAKKCKTDSWSHGRTVELLQNVDLSGVEFTPIPTFGGTFYGNGYTISGVSITRKGSYQGLFRYLQAGAVVRDLHVEGTVAPGGSRECIGGLVGEHSGVIQNCSFSGTVDGEMNVGGLCGYITESGVVEQSQFSGTVSGKTYTGGICGQNFGRVQACENHGAVNTTNDEQAKSIQDLEIDVSELRSTKNIDTNTDTGGICGYTKGSVIGCKNYGNVGYPAVGYNTGGICGRQAGYIGLCENYGEIKGRKDIGGIAGQAEPYVVLAFSKDIVGQTKDKIVEMQNSVDAATANIQAIVDGYGAISAVTESLDSLNASLSQVGSAAELVSDDVVDYADDAADSVNAVADRLHTALDASPEALDMLSLGADRMADGFSALQESGEYLENLADSLADAAEQAEPEQFADASLHLKRASSRFAQAMSAFEDSVSSVENGAKKLQQALRELSEALQKKDNAEGQFQVLWESLGEIQEGLSDAGEVMTDTADILQGLSDRSLIGGVADVIENLRQMAEYFQTVARALQTVGDACLALAEGFDIYSMQYAFRMLERGFDSLSVAFDRLQRGLRALSPVLDELETASEQGKQAANRAKDAMAYIGDGTDDLKRAVDRLQEIVTDLTADGAFALPRVSDGFRSNFDAFFRSIDDMQAELTLLNAAVRDAEKHTKDSASDVIWQINDEIRTLSDLLSDAFEEQADSKEDTIVEDVSDQDVVQDMRGKIDQSQNYGVVSGDVNVGGIVGSMAIEYDFDPEDDVVNSGEQTLRFTYQTKCVVRRSTNEGDVTAKKNDCGGIVGRMDLGSVIACDAYGTIASTDGDYIGGIAGKSDTVIRNCAAKCKLSGNRYVGGVAGSGSTIANCQTLVSIAGYEEFAGAIAGEAPRQELRNNLFINDALGGLDDISYTGLAAETDLAAFVAFVKSNFHKDVTFTLTFVADDKEIARVPFHYKEAIPEEQIPKVPEKNGYFGKWSSYDFAQPRFDAVIEAEYHRNMDIIASERTRENGKSVVLACGAFDDGAAITAVPGGQMPGKRTVDGYHISIDGSYTETYTIRYLPAAERGYAIYVQYGDTLKKANTKMVGSYVEFEVASADFQLYEVKKEIWPWLLLGFCGLAIIAAAAAGIWRYRKKAKGSAMAV